MEQSDEDIKDFVSKFQHILPNPDNYPRTIEFYWNVYKYQQSFNSKETKEITVK